MLSHRSTLGVVLSASCRGARHPLGKYAGFVGGRRSAAGRSRAMDEGDHKAVTGTYFSTIVKGAQRSKPGELVQLVHIGAHTHYNRNEPKR